MYEIRHHTSIIYELASTANNWVCVVSDLIDGLVEINVSLIT